MMSLLLLVPAFGVVVTLLIIAWLRPRDREITTLAAFAAAAGSSILASYKTALEHLVTWRATSGHVLAFPAKERILAEDYGEAVPRLVAASVILFVALVGCIALLRRARTRLIVLGAIGVLFIPIAFFGTRGARVHEQTTREAFAEMSPAAPDCFALTEAVGMAGSMDRAAQYDPDAPRLARQCISTWLTILDEGGDSRALLESNFGILQTLHGSKAGPAIDFIASSNLLTDADQKQDVERRKKLAETTSR